MSEAPFFSVIIPVFNEEDYISETVNSVLGQTCPDFQLILVNDGSTDRTSEICRKFLQDDPGKIKLIEQGNKGVSAARNAGIEASEGQYLVFVDGDDLLDKKALELMKKSLLETPSEMLYCDFLKTENHSSDSVLRSGKEAAMITAKECIISKLREDTIPVMAACYSRAMIKNNHIRFDEDLCFVEDALFFFSCVVESERIIYYPEILYYYLQRPDSVSHRKDHLMKEMGNELRAWRKIRQILPEDDEINALLLPRMRLIRISYLLYPLVSFKRALCSKFKR